MRAARLLLWLPLVAFVAIVAVTAFTLRHPSGSVITSKMIGQKMPAFALPPALPGRPGLASADLAGRPRVINIFASWCVPCAAEAGQLVELKQAGVEVDGIAIRDRPDDIAAFLERWGDGYARIGADRDSRVQVALGSSGVPESFIVDGRGIIRHQHIGAIDQADLPDILARVQAAGR